jgi:hypothetical protein
MTIITNTLTTYSAIGLREELSDVIDNISPTATPFYSAIRKKKIATRKPEWLTDSLASAANNAQLEGDDYTSFAAVAQPTRWDQYAQISAKSFIVSRTENIVDKAGRDKEIDYQTLKKTKEIKRDVEVAIIGNTTYNAGAAGTARQTRGLAGWVRQGSVGAGAGVFPVPSTNTAPVAGTARAWSEALLKGMAQAAYNAGGEPTLLIVRPADKALTSAFAGNATRFEKVEQSTITAAYDWYVSDFGKFKVVPDRFCDAAAYLVDLDHVSFGTLDPLVRSPLAKTGDAEKMLLTMEYALVMDNLDAHAVARDLS